MTVNIYPEAGAALKKVHNQPWNHTIEVGELYKEMEKKFVKELEQCIKDHQHLEYDQKIYIQVIQRKDNNFGNVLDNKIYVRFSRPEPGPNMYLFSYSKKDNLKFEWCIPSEAIVEMILTHPMRHAKFDAEWIKILQKYRMGTLK